MTDTLMDDMVLGWLSLDIDTLDTLSRHTHDSVRRRVAGNNATASSTLVRLVTDGSPTVASRAIEALLSRGVDIIDILGTEM